jgi:Family of unknown function (DUF5329)
MNLRSTMGLTLMMGLFLLPVARAETPTNVQTEINFLLGFIEGSGCVFYRNGTWHDSKAAQVHLREKYNYLMTANKIDTTEDFIEKVATKSSFSGQPYQVRCNGGATLSSSQWLLDELARLRTLK